MNQIKDIRHEYQSNGCQFVTKKSSTFVLQLATRCMYWTISVWHSLQQKAVGSISLWACVVPDPGLQSCYDLLCLQSLATIGYTAQGYRYTYHKPAPSN